MTSFARACAATSERKTQPVAWRCWNCQKLLGRFMPPIAFVERTCDRCGQINVLTTEIAAEDYTSGHNLRSEPR